MQDETHSGNPWYVRIATLGTFFGLLIVLAVGLAPNLNTRVVGIGEAFWPNYARDLRTDQEPPTCDLEDIRARLAQCPTEDAAAAPPSAEGDDPFAGEDPFAEPSGEAAEADDPFAGDDPFAEPSEEAAETDDPFAGDDPFAEPSGEAAEADDPFAGDDPFAEAKEPAPKVNCAALRNLSDRCEIRHAAYTQIQERLTPGVKRFRAMEGTIASIAKFPLWKHLLVLLVLLGGIATTAHRAHLSLRDPRNPLEHQVEQGAQLIAHLSLLASCYADRMVQHGSSAEAQHTEIPYLWMLGFVILAILNIHNLLKTPDKVDGPTSIPRLLMVVPLYCYMVLIGAVYFLFIEGHYSGQAIFLHKFLQHPTIYLGIGLYIWAGMMLSKTTIAKRSFDVLTPFGLPPTLLAWTVIMFAAIPTAYSGASGIFVIAAGAVIFEQLRSAGVSKRIALAATAMSGSLGVVLRPCLVVVLIAVLNKQVTTQQLFDNGLKVFILTAVLSLIAMLMINRDGFKLLDDGSEDDGSIISSDTSPSYTKSNETNLENHELVYEPKAYMTQAIALILLITSMFLPWIDVGPISLDGWSIVEFFELISPIVYGIYLMPLSAGYALWLLYTRGPKDGGRSACAPSLVAALVPALIFVLLWSQPHETLSNDALILALSGAELPNDALILALSMADPLDDALALALSRAELGAWLCVIVACFLMVQGLRSTPASFVQRLRKSVKASKQLMPFLALTIVVLVFYWLALDTTITEHTAPYVMPGLLLALVAYDRLIAAPRDHAVTPDSPKPERLWPALLDATHESSSHIGALLTVMFASVGLGGVVERAELMQLLPSDFGSVYMTMAFLVVVMVLVGMTMDALGAVVLVSVSVAGVAYANGIDPVHFWMMVLVAFELGYLTPPVALNHLLARQVIGAEAHVENDPDLSFYARYEHLIVPMAIMGTALILVAFVPLAFY